MAIIDHGMNRDLKNWEEFEDWVKELRSLRAENLNKTRYIVPEFLFRGQGDHSWTLETTLEREKDEPLSFADYFSIILNARHQIETITGNRWKIPDWEELQSWCLNYHNLINSLFPGYDYLVYLRHHGFPSPLLDWTRSPYIAAYFAFAEKPPKGVDRVAVYAYWENKEIPRPAVETEEPRIASFGPYIRSHPRHFLQQSQYTIGAQFKNKEWRYLPHEKVTVSSPARGDVIWRVTIPSTERLKILKNLEDYNLNAYSLFQTEEALLKTIAVREMKLRKKDY